MLTISIMKLDVNTISNLGSLNIGKAIICHNRATTTEITSSGETDSAEAIPSPPVPPTVAAPHIPPTVVAPPTPPTRVIRPITPTPPASVEPLFHPPSP